MHKGLYHTQTTYCFRRSLSTIHEKGYQVLNLHHLYQWSCLCWYQGSRKPFALELKFHCQLSFYQQSFRCASARPIHHGTGPSRRDRTLPETVWHRFRALFLLTEMRGNYRQVKMPHKILSSEASYLHLYRIFVKMPPIHIDQTLCSIVKVRCQYQPSWWSLGHGDPEFWKRRLNWSHT